MVKTLTQHAIDFAIDAKAVLCNAATSSGLHECTLEVECCCFATSTNPLLNFTYTKIFETEIISFAQLVTIVTS